ncbi:MAG: tetratricopeptide repeat protein, partial [Alphaproteobacteria bacterium]
MRKPNRQAKIPRPAPAAGAKPAKPADLARLEEDLRARLATKPEDKAAWQHLAVILAQSTRPKEAVEAFAKAVALGAPVGPICTPYAIALSNLGRHNEAAELVSPVLALNPIDFQLKNL